MVCLYRLADLELVCRRPLDAEYDAIRISQDGLRIVCIGGARSLAGVSFSLMTLQAAPSAEG